MLTGARLLSPDRCTARKPIGERCTKCASVLEYSRRHGLWAELKFLNQVYDGCQDGGME